MCGNAISTRFLNPSSDDDSTTSLGSQFQCLTTLSVIFPNIQSKPPLMQLEAISCHPITSYLGKETNNHLTTTTFQVVVESDKVSLQPPLLQTEQPQLPQSCAMVENRLGKHILHALKLSQRDGAL